MCTKTVLLWAKRLALYIPDIDNLYGDYHIIAHNTEHFLTHGNCLRKYSKFKMEMTWKVMCTN